MFPQHRVYFKKSQKFFTVCKCRRGGIPPREHPRREGSSFVRVLQLYCGQSVCSLKWTDVYPRDDPNAVRVRFSTESLLELTRLVQSLKRYGSVSLAEL